MTDKMAMAIERYFELWNQRNSDARAAGIREVFAANAAYTDPLVDVKGHSGIGAVISGIQSQFPDHTFKLLSSIEAHHHVARFSWELIPPSSAHSVAMGMEVASFDDDWKIRRVYVFMDVIPFLAH
jgi:hypothetical protein